MRRPAIAILGGLWCVTAFGQDLIECIDPDVLAGLIFRSPAQQDTVTTAAVPDEFTGVMTPTEFEWIGSSSRPMGIVNGAPMNQVTGAFRTALAPDDALDLAMAGLVSDGWEVMQELGRMAGAFVTQVVRAHSATACLGGDPVNVLASSINDTTYVTYNFSSGSQNMVCAANARPSLGATFAVDKYMPRLEFPPDPVTGRPVYPSGRGGGGNMTERNSRAEVRHGESIGNLTNYLSQQLSDQGWRADASWTGRTTAGSSWSMQPEPEMNLRATLQVLEVDDSFYNVTFRITTVQ